MGYNNSAKAKMIRIAADEKDKKFASKAGVERLDKDISKQIGGKTSINANKSILYNQNKDYKESDAQEKLDLMKMPEAYKQMSQSGTFLTKHMSTSMEMGGSKSAMLQTKQGYNDRLDETLGSKDGKEAQMTQSMKARRDESKGMEKKLKQGAYSSNTKMS